MLKSIPIEAQITIAITLIAAACVFLPVGWFYFREFLKSLPVQKKRRWRIARRWVKKITIAALIFWLLIKIAPQAYQIAKGAWKPHYGLWILALTSISATLGLIMIFLLMVRQGIRGEGLKESASSILTKRPKGMSNRQRLRLRRNGRPIAEPSASQQQTEPP